MAEKTRLNKFISESGICSRREADKFIEQGHVFVNGKRAAIGTLVSVHDKVMLNGQLIKAKVGNDFVFLAFNKPSGIISTTEIGVKNSIIDYIGYHERIFPIGRLDKESQGLIFMTNNGDIVNKILRAGNKHEKEYLVTVNKPITDEFIQKMGAGVPILGEVTKKCKVVKESVYTFHITLIQGLNRQIRRMCEYFDFEVIKLERIRIMNISLKNLPLGEWRQLETDEMEQIMNAVANSTSTVENSPIKKNDATQKSKKHVSQYSNSTPTVENRKTKPAERATNPNPKSKELRGGSSNGKLKKFDSRLSRNAAASHGNKGNSRSSKR